MPPTKVQPQAPFPAFLARLRALAGPPTQPRERRTPKAPRPLPLYRLVAGDGHVLFARTAPTRSEFRGYAAQALGLDRLPPGAKILVTQPSER